MIPAAESYSRRRVESEIKRAKTMNDTVTKRVQRSAVGLRAEQGSKLDSTNFTVGDTSDTINAEGVNPIR